MTYHGFGGAMPVEYILENEEPRGVDFLRFWRKGSPRRRRLASFRSEIGFAGGGGPGQAA